MDLNKIYNVDCVIGLRQLPADSIDLTVTSPPYDNLRKYNGFSWDFETTAKELYRVTKPGGVVVWVVGDATINGSETGTSFRQALFFMENGFNLHDTMIYRKLNPTPQKSRRYQSCFEYMFVFSKGKPKTFNPILVDKKYMENRDAKMYNRGADGSHTAKKYAATSSKRIKENIWGYSVGLFNSTSDRYAFEHPALFPEQLAADHINSWSNSGDTILDPFMGSGTTAKMALLSGRNFIGFELSAEYCQLANKRIDDARTNAQTIYNQEEKTKC